MKKIFYLLLFVSTAALAQNVGINASGTAPNASAGLDVDFTNKGVLVPRVALTGATDATTIPSPATSLLVYNLGTGGLSPAGYYYNSGTSASPAWTRVSNDISPTYFTTGSQQFTAAGSSNFTVPAGITRIKVLIVGAGGGGCYGSGLGYGGLGGAGGGVVGVLDVTPGEVLSILVGAGGAGIVGANPGSGGAGSSISRGATLLAAAGGGGGGNGNSTATNANPGAANGGGGSFGTSINGATGNTSPTGASAAGGSNYLGYLKEALSFCGSGYNSPVAFTTGTATGTTGYLIPAIAIDQSTAFGFGANITNGKGGCTASTVANSTGRPGYISIIW